MVDKEDELKKNLVDALKVFGINISDDLKEKKETRAKELLDYEEMSLSARKKMDELNERGEEMLQKIGMTREALEIYGNNPNNFTEEQWKALTEIKEVSERYRALTSEWMTHSIDKEFLEKEQRKPRGKFAKRKHWIPL